MYNGIDAGMLLYETTDDSIMKMMVVLSDGASSGTNRHSWVVSLANENKVRIYTVGLGSSISYFEQYLEPLTSQTGGKFYLSSNASEKVL